MAHVPDAALYEFHTLSHVEALLYVCYCARRNRYEHFGWAWPSDRKVNEDVGIHYTYVPKARKRLLERGWLLACAGHKQCVLLVRGFEDELISRGIIRMIDGTPLLLLACPRHPLTAEKKVRKRVTKSKSESNIEGGESKTESNISAEIGGVQSKTQSTQSKTQSTQSKTQTYSMEPCHEPPLEPERDGATVPAATGAGRFTDPPDPRYWRGAEPDEIYEAFERACRMPSRAVQSETQREELFQNWKVVHKAGLLAADIDMVTEFWFTAKLAGQQGVPPTPKQVRENIEAARQWKAAQSAPIKRETDDRWRAHYQEELAKRLRDMTAADPRRQIVQEVLAQVRSVAGREQMNMLLQKLAEHDITIS